MIERVEMIARLVSESSCRQRDKEIALNWIAEIVKDDLSPEKFFSNDTHAT
nr:Tum protein [Klebsiella michiganensis]